MLPGTGKLPRASGFTLVELMVASTLGLLLLAWMTDFLVDTARLNREMSNTRDLVERGRLAVQFLREDLQHAGHWGAHVSQFEDPFFSQPPGDLPDRVPDPCRDPGEWAADSSVSHLEAILGIPVQTGQGAPGIGCALLLAAESDGPATDVLVVRYAATCKAGEQDCDAFDPRQLYFQASNCPQQIDAGDAYTLSPDASSLSGKDCIEPAAKRRFVQNLYFVRTSGRGEPALYRSGFGVSSGAPRQMRAQELIPGVEGLRVTLGIDNLGASGLPVDYHSPRQWLDPDLQRQTINRGDGAPDGEFVHCSREAPCTPGQLANVVAVRLHLLVRAPLETPGYRNLNTYYLGAVELGPFNDAFKREVFSVTVALRNRVARRSAP